MESIADALKAGMDCHHSGDLRQAEQIYRRILQADPRHAQALHLLGLIAYQAGNHPLAVQYASAAIRLDGRQAEYHTTLAEAHRKLGQPAEAVSCYRQALRIQPDYAVAHNNLGTLLQARGDLAAAGDCYREAVRVEPEYADAHRNLGLVLRAQGRLDEAAECHAEAARLKPQDHDIQMALANVLAMQGKLSEAMAHFEAAAQARPDSTAAQIGMGIALQAHGQLDRAADCFRRAIQIDPRCASAHFYLGTVMRSQDRDFEAIGCFQDALRHDPLLVDAHLGLSSLFRQLVRPDEAVAASRRAIELAPQSAPAFAQWAMALQLQGESAAAIAAYRRAVELDPNDAFGHSNLLYALNFQPACDPAALFAEHRAWAQRHAERLTVVAAPHENQRVPERRLRVGYVSAHFREHAVSFFSEPMIAAHDHGQFEVFCYADVHRADAVTQRFQTAADQWRDITDLSDQQAAELIRKDQIDILVDLAGHIGNNRLLTFARKPAPVQVTYLGYQNTTGMSAMDYRLTDEHADPPGLTEAYYTERLVRLPRSFFCFLPPQPSPEVNDLPALANGHMTFASLNHIHKLTHEAFETWARILLAVPQSRLLVLAYSPGQFERNVRDRMSRAGVDPGRVEVANKRPRYEYLQLHGQIDIALDAFPFNGHTTVCDALWMGVPSIMLEGSSYASRFGGSTLLNLGLKDLIAHRPEQYVEIAVALAGDLPRLSALRRGLRARMQDSPLVDAIGFTRNLESAYRRMWNEWCQATPEG
jgi:protein O-GlcNAc transferase